MFNVWVFNAWVFNAPTAPLQTSGKAGHTDQGDPAAEVCAASPLQEGLAMLPCVAHSCMPCVCRGWSKAWQGKSSLPVHKWLREFPAASFCGCLEERGKSRWGLCLTTLAHAF